LHSVLVASNNLYFQWYASHFIYEKPVVVDVPIEEVNPFVESF